MKNREEYKLTIRPRESESVTINVPIDTLASLRKIAAIRDMSEQALLKFYIGQGLRHDLSRYHSDQVMETTAEVLARHIESEEEVSVILREIRTTYYQ